MKEKELRENAECSRCGKKIGHTGLPMFWRVTFERHLVDMGAVRRQSGLAMMLGSGELAMALGADQEMTKPILNKTITLCEECVYEERSLGALALET